MSRALSEIVNRPCRNRGAGCQVRESVAHGRGAIRVRKLRAYPATPGFESRSRKCRFLSESSHVRKRTKTCLPAKRTPRILIVGRLFPAGAGDGDGVGVAVAATVAVTSDVAVAEPVLFFAVTATRTV
jgi:hypothetical protein